MSTAATKAVATDAPPMVEVMVVSLVDVTKDIFSTMLNRAVEFGEPSFKGPQPTANVVATVGFAGTLSGYISLCVSKDAALEIAQALLGSDADEAPAHVRDAAGEMANMIAGSVRTVMADRGENVGISTPIVTVGTDFSTAALRDVSQAVCPFKMGTHDSLFVYLVLQGKGRK
jgi:chemotaxis protein CheX